MAGAAPAAGKLLWFRLGARIFRSMGEVPLGVMKKPGAMAGSTPLEQWCAQGRLPPSYDRFWSMTSDPGKAQS